MKHQEFPSTLAFSKVILYFFIKLLLFLYAWIEDKPLVVAVMWEIHGDLKWNSSTVSGNNTFLRPIRFWKTWQKSNRFRGLSLKRQKSALRSPDRFRHLYCTIILLLTFKGKPYSRALQTIVAFHWLRNGGCRLASSTKTNFVGLVKRTA